MDALDRTHRTVLHQHIAPQFGEAAVTAVVDQVLQQQGAKANTAPVVLHQHREFSTVGGFVDVNPAYATHLSWLHRFIHQHTSGFQQGVDVAHSLCHGCRQFGHRMQETAPDVRR